MPAAKTTATQRMSFRRALLIGGFFFTGCPRWAFNGVDSRKKRAYGVLRNQNLPWFGKMKEVASIVTPHTLLSWHRRLIACKYNSSWKRRVRRPTIQEEIRELVVKFTSENRHWGYTSIQGFLLHLRHEVGRTTVGTILENIGKQNAQTKY